MGVRPNGLGAGRAGEGQRRDEATASRHRGFLDVAADDGDRPSPRGALRSIDPLAHLDERALLAEAHRVATPPLDDDDMEPITKWPLVVGMLVAAIALLVGFAELGSLPFR